MKTYTTLLTLLLTAAPTIAQDSGAELRLNRAGDTKNTI